MKKYLFIVALIFTFILGYCSYNEETFIITRVVDGDTIQLNDGRKIRLIGVDTPEKYDGSKLTNDSKKSGKSKEIIKQEGERSSDFTKKLCEGKKCKLVFDKNKFDRYNRTLAYVVLEDGKVLNEEIIKNGYGIAYTSFYFKDKIKYLKLENEARNNKVGLWK